MICEACGKNEAIGVYCVPGVPISCAYCRDCSLYYQNKSIEWFNAEVEKSKEGHCDKRT